MKDLFFFEMRGCLIAVSGYCLDLALDNIDFIYGFDRSLPTIKHLATWSYFDDAIEFVDLAARARFIELMAAVGVI